jgi:hypothetical protein
MVKRSSREKMPARVRQRPVVEVAKVTEEGRPAHDRLFQGLQEIYIHLLRVELYTALILAHMSRDPVSLDFREKAKEQASGIYRDVSGAANYLAW